jgi:ribose transport system substrate-binding protein
MSPSTGLSARGTHMRLSKYLAGCAAAAALTFAFGSASAFAETFALVTINQQALFFNQINDGAKAAAKAVGADLVIFNANNVPSAQNDAIENYITQKVDGIILVAIDVNGVKPAVTAAKNAGIPVIAIDAQIPDGDNIAFVGVDNTKAGGDIGKFYADYVKSKMGGSAKIGVVGALNSYIQNQRLDGFKKAVADSGEKVTFLDTVDGQNVQDVALSAAENLMTANPDMTTLYATGEHQGQCRQLPGHVQVGGGSNTQTATTNGCGLRDIRAAETLVRWKRHERRNLPRQNDRYLQTLSDDPDA